jgi:transposase
MSEQARKVRNEAIPQWAEGLYYNKGRFKEALLYHDGEALYFEVRGKEGMKSYSEDLRRKIVAAVERGMSKTQAARLFDVSLSSVKRYSRMAHRGNSLAPKERPGRAPKVDEKTKKLLIEDMKERPAAIIAERIRFLESITGEHLSYSTIWRLLKRLGWSRKKECGCSGTRQVAQSCLEDDARCADRSEAARVRRRDGNQYFAFSDLCLFTEGTEGVLLGSAQPRAEHDTALVHER